MKSGESGKGCTAAVVQKVKGGGAEPMIELYKAS